MNHFDWLPEKVRVTYLQKNLRRMKKIAARIDAIDQQSIDLLAHSTDPTETLLQKYRRLERRRDRLDKLYQKLVEYGQ